ncbi:hypothetical protein [Flavilitoribacter nigricans]|uniref:DUF4932 domain-containing protein n=1 Tax=Flavilitoribacter nigricans (strain ATCC 23147 / DSM 23189 / NBRC 102662 / NCIMB 1420 / SS-2) TaxID=1122177 RepID=A0A2D0N821_FLAN2|nr:hypothetical protein [Flavilitoribacter nigricans]PHN04661.1 hypothetical protein CRP01_19270 [Flavilitoribacter nigricans DSM 23189 = NBRC 102662]
MKYLFLPFLLAVLSCRSNPNASNNMTSDQLPGLLHESEHFSFYNPFWLNLHHFLHHEVLHRDTARADVFPTRWMAQLDPAEQAIVRETVKYYQRELVDQDLRTSDYMTAFKSWSGQQPEDQFSSIPDPFRQHADHLLAFAPIYRQHFWPEQNQANREIMERNLPLIRNIEDDVHRQLSAWAQAEWPAEKIRVDITYYAKSYRNYGRDRPFTTLHPTHVVMNATGHEVDGNWVELLFHEASHHLITPNNGKVSEVLKQAARDTSQELPGGLWHAYLFYFSGKACQEAFRDHGLPDYELYMIRNRVFADYHPFLKEYLSPYLEGKSTLLESSQALLLAYPRE